MCKSGIWESLEFQKLQGAKEGNFERNCRIFGKVDSRSEISSKCKRKRSSVSQSSNSIKCRFAYAEKNIELY